MKKFLIVFVSSVPDSYSYLDLNVEVESSDSFSAVAIATRELSLRVSSIELSIIFANLRNVMVLLQKH